MSVTCINYIYKPNHYVSGSPVSTMWTHLSSTAYAGDVIITLMDPVFQWSSGDQIVIATTGDRHSHYQNEKRTISSVSGDGRTLTLDTALVYDHLGVELNLTASSTLQARAEVGLLSHNILFRGAANLQWTDDITMCEEDYNIGKLLYKLSFECFLFSFELWTIPAVY